MFVWCNCCDVSAAAPSSSAKFYALGLRAICFWAASFPGYSGHLLVCQICRWNFCGLIRCKEVFTKPFFRPRAICFSPDRNQLIQPTKANPMNDTNTTPPVLSTAPASEMTKLPLGTNPEEQAAIPSL